jgi:methyltransferase (TIGR00027 family)
MVSVARGIGVSAALRDPMAHAFSNGPLTRRVDRFGSSSRSIEAARLAMRALSLGLVDHNTLRMLIVDRELQTWLASGIRQVVLLGAGLDSRGFRLDGLGDCQLFELDHPDTQAFKRTQAASLSPRAKSIAFVPVDFDRDDLGQTLAAAGHRADEPSAWICEGVIAYLKPAVTANVLREVGAASAPGSYVALSYVTPLRAGKGAASKALVALLLRQLGERAQGFVSKSTVHELLTSFGMTPLEDTGWDEWQQRFPDYSPLPNLFKERLVIARKG